MKILSLVSSYRANGNTNRVVSLIEKQLSLIAHEDGMTLEIENIQLHKFDIKQCCGCRACFNKGEEKCPFKDDLLVIRNKLYEADAILAASPVYVEDVNGLMKNWIDRMAFICHRPAFAGKSAYIVTTSGGGSSNHSINTIKNAFITWGISIIGSSKFSTSALLESDEIQARYGNEIRKAAEALFKAVKSKSSQKPSLYSLIAFKVQKKYWLKKTICKNSVDYKYWLENEWLQRDCDYYIPNKAGFLKIKLAQLIGSIVAAFYAK